MEIICKQNHFLFFDCFFTARTTSLRLRMQIFLATCSSCSFHFLCCSTLPLAKVPLHYSPLVSASSNRIWCCYSVAGI